MPEFTVIIPVKNEAENIASLSGKIRLSLSGIDHEVIWVNDGSTDNSSNIIMANANERTILVELKKNYGQSAAMQAGIHQASGNYIAFLDGDGQNDPADIPTMFSILREGNYDMVAGQRTNRQDSFLKKIPSSIANALIRKMTGINLRDFGCSLRIVKKEWALCIPLSKGMHRYFNVMICKKGARVKQVMVTHHPRIAGKSKYGLGRLFPVLADLLRVMKNTGKSKEPYLVKHYEIARRWQV
jgi:glycosyltransferase involved in cell wall biosynthesis